MKFGEPISLVYGIIMCGRTHITAVAHPVWLVLHSQLYTLELQI